jgi:hypothetical protein
MKQAFSRSLYNISVYPYCINTHNKVLYSCEFAVYVVIFGAVRDISVMKQAFSRSLYNVSVYPYCLNTHNKVLYSFVFSVYVVIFGAVRDISVMKQAFSRALYKISACLSYSKNAVCLSTACTTVTLASASSLNTARFFWRHSLQEHSTPLIAKQNYILKQSPTSQTY